jgi:hypothetical protein
MPCRNERVIWEIRGYAYFDGKHPLTACLGLPGGETWRAVEWLDEPVDGLPLVTLSAC